MKKLLLAGCSVAVFAAFGAGVKISEKFGFDAADSTRFLQAALNSNEQELILDKRDTPWIATPLLCTNGNKTIRFEDGAWLVAKRGEFHGHVDSLLVFKQCKGVKLIGAGAEKCGLKMWRDDYASTNLYKHSEHRMAISVNSCEDVLIEGISANESGGDGLYISNLGRNTDPCRNVVVRNCVFDKNYRQGISVISAVNLLIENVVMSNTKGTPPMAGIDFEPNGYGEKMVNIVMRNCLTTNNANSGYCIVPNYFNSESAKVSITFENCRSIDDAGHGFTYHGAFGRKSGYDAEIPYRESDVVLKNCSFVRSGRQAVSIFNRPLSSGSFVMENCLIDNCGIDKPDDADVSVCVTGHEGYEPYVVDFRNVTIRQGKARNWLDVCDKPQPYKGEPTRLCGKVTVEAEGKTASHTLDSAWREKNTPFTPCETKEIVRRVKADLSKVKIVDTAPGAAIQCDPVFVRTPTKKRFYTRYVFHAEKGKEVAINFLVKTRTGVKPKGMFQVGKYDDMNSMIYRKTFSREKVPLKFTVPETGFYEIRMRSACSAAVVSFNVPIAIDATKGRVGLLGVKNPVKGVKGFKGAKLYANVAEGVKAFTAAYYGDGREALNARFCDPDGNVAYEFEPVIGLRYARVDNPKSGLWTLQLDPPKKCRIENHVISLNGIPGWYFLSPEKMWK